MITVAIWMSCLNGIFYSYFLEFMGYGKPVPIEKKNIMMDPYALSDAELFYQKYFQKSSNWK